MTDDWLAARIARRAREVHDLDPAEATDAAEFIASLVRREALGEITWAKVCSEIKAFARAQVAARERG